MPLFAGSTAHQRASGQVTLSFTFTPHARSYKYYGSAKYRLEM